MWGVRLKRRRVEVFDFWLTCNLGIVLMKIEQYRQNTRKLNLQAIIEWIAFGFEQ